MRIIYDLELRPNCFLFLFEDLTTGQRGVFEISDYCNQYDGLMWFIDHLRANNYEMVGFNNVHYDYPILHGFIDGLYTTAWDAYQKSREIFTAENRFAHVIPNWLEVLKQIDLFKIHHFDNAAKRTSLKLLEFNFRMVNIQELPFDPLQPVDYNQLQALKAYGFNNIEATKLLYDETIEAIDFRAEMSRLEGKDYTNFNDTKIGEKYFIARMEEAGVPCFTQGDQPRQTHRGTIDLNQLIFSYIQFGGLSPFNGVLQWLRQQQITETKQVFDNLTVNTGGLEYKFGTGGVHASVVSKTFRECETYEIVDIDVASYYPHIPIANRIYPEHLSEVFCDIYQQVYEKRKQYKKGTVLNGALKLALNGVYGKSNSVYSCFYDPAFTMSVTINGQLLLCMLADSINRIPDAKITQVNTDGLTVYIPRGRRVELKRTTQEWEALTKMSLEYNYYKLMAIRDVNNYIAIFTDGKVKQKGTFETDRALHKNHGGLVIPKAVKVAIVCGVSPRDFILNHSDIYDFCFRTKLDSKSKLFVGDRQGSRITRYYITDNSGETLTKAMPPLPGKTEWRYSNVEAGWKVCECNNISNATLPVNYSYYIREAEKLLNNLGY